MPIPAPSSHRALQLVACSVGLASFALFFFAPSAKAAAQRPAPAMAGGGQAGGPMRPSGMVDDVAEKKSEQSESVARGWLGVKIQNVDQDTAKSLGLPNAAGALVTGILPAGPAAGADLKVGDVILEFQGSQIADSRGLARKVAEFEPDQKVDLVIWRSESKSTVSLKLGALPEGLQTAETGAAETPKLDPRTVFGLKLETANGGGLVVAEVDAGSSAAAKGFRKGDVLMEAQGAALKGLGDLASAIDKNMAKGAILFKVKSGEALRFVALPLKLAAPHSTPAPRDDEKLGDLDKLE